jgi:rhodanese-related sulfurtransferase
MQVLALARNPQVLVASLAVVLAIALQSERTIQTFNATDVSVPEAISLIESGALVIDVRGTPNSHLPGALLIPLEVLSARLASMEVAKTQPIVVYCGNGSRLGPEAAHVLTQGGYTHVVNLQPGIEGWRAAGLPVVSS